MACQLKCMAHNTSIGTNNTDVPSLTPLIYLLMIFSNSCIYIYIYIAAYIALYTDCAHLPICYSLIIILASKV